MTASKDMAPGSDAETELRHEMAKHGVTRTAHDTFRYMEFRYATLKAATDQAKLDRPELKHVPIPDAGQHAEMARFGITLVPMAYFSVGRFRYTRLSDAIAEAKRHPVAS